MRRSLYRDEEHVEYGGDDEQHDVETLLLLLHLVYNQRRLFLPKRIHYTLRELELQATFSRQRKKLRLLLYGSV
jgi:hypothetical protein